MQSDVHELRESDAILDEIKTTRASIDRSLGELGERFRLSPPIEVVQRLMARAADRAPAMLLIGSFLVGVISARLTAGCR